MQKIFHLLQKNDLFPDMLTVKYSLVLGSAFTTLWMAVKSFLEKYYFSDHEFLGFVIVALSIDTLSGSVKHMLHKPSTFKATIFGAKLFAKIVAISAGLGLTHLIAFSVFDDGFFSTYTLMFGEATMMFYVLKSIDENIEDMTAKKLSFSILIKTFFDFAQNKLNTTNTEKHVEEK